MSIVFLEKDAMYLHSLTPLGIQNYLVIFLDKNTLIQLPISPLPIINIFTIKSYKLNNPHKFIKFYIIS